MICENCHGNVPNGARFCAACGHKAIADIPEEIQHRVARLELTVKEGVGRISAEQKYLDVDTTERIVARVMKWAKVFAVCVGVPITLAAIFLGIYLHRNIGNLRDLADTIDNSVRPAVEKANAEAARAKATADDALGRADQVSQNIGKTNQNLQRLDDSVQQSQSRVNTLDATVAASSLRVQQLTRQTAGAVQSRNVASLGQTYPSFGEHVVRTTEGNLFKSSDKKPGEVYVGVNFDLESLTPDPKLRDRTAKFMAALQGRSYYVFPPGPIFLDAISDQIHQDIAEIDADSCVTLAQLPGPPCIVYFRTDAAAALSEIVRAAQDVQSVASDRVKFVDPLGINPLKKELVQKSGLDFVVVFEAR